MNALAAYTGQAIAAPAQDLTPVMFTDFVAWIDRGEKTTRTYITNLRQFAAWLKYADVVRPVRQDIYSYRDYLSAEHDAIKLAPGTAAGWTYRTDSTGTPLKVNCKPNTVVQYLRVVRQFFAWTAANGIYPDVAANVHAPKLKRDTHRREYLKADEVKDIENSIETKAQARTEAAAAAKKDTKGRVERSTEQGKRLYAMYELAVTAGLRTVEISRADIKDFTTKGGQAWLYIWGKGHTEPDQKKPLAPEVANAITDYLDSRRDKKTAASPLFVSTGNRSGGKRIAPTTISKMLKKAMKDAGYNSEKLTAHSLRHSAAMGVLEITGSNLYETQKYMRHENPATTEIYLHETEEQEQQQADLAQRLYSLFHGEHADDESRSRLENLIKRMNPQQIDQLAGIAQALAK